MQKFSNIFKKCLLIFLINFIIFNGYTSVFAEDAGSAAIASDMLSVAAFDVDSSTPNASVSVSGNGQNSSSNTAVDADVPNNSSIYDASDAPETYSGADILLDLNTSKILYSKNADEKMYPASTTKVMTAILTLENCKLTDVATVSHNAVFSIPSGYSIASLREGEELTIEQLLNVLLIPSANDAAVVLAEHIAGSVESFANMMNAKAKEIGCTNTNFVNPNGIHNVNHYSTAHDLALIGQYAMKFDVFKQIASKTSYSLPATNKYDKTDRMFNTTNELIKVNHSSSPRNYYYKYATAGKTGYTDAAKSCIIATAKKDNRSLLVVVLHGSTNDDGLSQRALDCKNLFEYGFNSFKYETIIHRGDVAKSVTVKNGTDETKELNLIYSDDVNVLVPTSYDLSNVASSANIELTEQLYAPISEGTVLGNSKISVYGSDYSVDLIASHTVYKANTLKTIMELLLLIIFLFFFAKIIKIFSKKKNKKRKNFRGKSTAKKSSKKKKSKHLSKDMDNFYPKY